MIDSSEREVTDIRGKAAKPPRSLRYRIMDVLGCVVLIGVICYFQDADFKRWVNAKFEALGELLGTLIALAMAYVWLSLAAQLYWPRLRPTFYLLLSIALFWFWWRVIPA